ncbi:hypothetical protein MNV49_005486 [Pseudohyphozyma bogoriensis]|nr:hypothetical protein MNV49_005486 [Pseudohyphozyma bogoriensis]
MASPTPSALLQAGQPRPEEYGPVMYDSSAHWNSHQPQPDPRQAYGVGGYPGGASAVAAEHDGRGYSSFEAAYPSQGTFAYSTYTYPNSITTHHSSLPAPHHSFPYPLASTAPPSAPLIAGPSSVPYYDLSDPALFANLAQNPPYEPSTEFVDRKPFDWLASAYPAATPAPPPLSSRLAGSPPQSVEGSSIYAFPNSTTAFVPVPTQPSYSSYELVETPTPGPSTTSAASTSTNPAIVSLQISCWTCGMDMARVNVRSSECANSGAEPRGGRASTMMQAMSEVDGVSYKDTISAAVDALEGLSLNSDVALRPRPLLKVDKEKIGPDSTLLICEACSRPLGSGAISPAGLNAAPLPPSSLQMEAVCTKCAGLYKLCSDCGGGGGRLSAGRWRCKELFGEGRKTCRLSHMRAPAPEDRFYEVFNIKEVKPGEQEELEKKLRVEFFNNRLGSLARPEQLERGDGLARTFHEAERMAIDGWNLALPMIRDDIEESRGIVRYVGIQTAVSGRRKAGESKEPRSDKDKVVIGFMLAEYEFKSGALFLAIISPWATLGKSNEANSVMCERLITRVRADLATRNRQRQESGLELHPSPSCTWVISPFKLDSKYSSTLERRGYGPLETMREWPLFQAEAFPPLREIYIPAPFNVGWTVYIRPLMGDDDTGAPPRTVKKR